MDGWSFLDKTGKFDVQPVFVIVGKEYYLKTLAAEKLESLVIPEAAEMARSAFDGDDVEWATVKDDLETPPFGSAVRFVLVRDADDFVSKYREKLEAYVKKPSRCGVLVLVVETWMKTTRLAKAIPEWQTIVCDPKKPHLLGPWLAKWCEKRHGRKIGQDAMGTLLTLVEPDFGLLNQELEKLATYVGKRESITAKDVDLLVGRNQSSTVWVMLDALAEGRKADAFGTLQQLLEQGDDPNAILGGLSWQLRKLAQTHRLLQQGISLQGAMAQAGMPPFKAQSVQAHLKQLGTRADSLYDWLLEVEQTIKSSDRLSPAAGLQRLLMRMA